MWAALAAPALAQRVQFPSAIEPASPYYTGYAQVPTYGAPPPYSQPPAYSAPVNGAPAYGAVAPPYGVQPAYPTSPYAPAPGATLDGNIYSPPGGAWDPYANNGTGSPGAGCAPACGVQEPVGASTRFFQHLSLQQTYLHGDGEGDLEINSTEIAASFAVPFLYNAQPLVLTPGFGLHLLQGPRTTDFAGAPDLPPQLYDVYLDTSWRPQPSPYFGADIGLRLGMYTDFQEVNNDSLRLTGRAIGLFTLSPRWTIAAGLMYIDREHIKVLPAGGLIWTPNADVRWEAVFPRPKLSQRLTTWGNTDVWGYLGAEYGGGYWTIERANGDPDRVELNDIRVVLGFDFINYAGWRGNLEAGYVFDRHILYTSITPDIHPDDTFMIRAGFQY